VLSTLIIKVLFHVKFEIDIFLLVVSLLIERSREVSRSNYWRFYNDSRRRTLRPLGEFRFIALGAFCNRSNNSYASRFDGNFSPHWS